jgi:hypothetical protein
MKIRYAMTASAAITLLACAAAAPAPANSAWTGVWQGQLDGQPSVTLTLAEDGGALGGTLVLDLIERQQDGLSRIVAIDPHVLLRAHADGNRLSFEVVRRNDSHTPMRFIVALDGGDKAHLHCLNCGPDTPIADLVRAQ